MADQFSDSWRPGKRVAIVGAGPGGVSTAMAMRLQGYDVRLYERAAESRSLGGGVLLSVPVLAVLRHYGIDIDRFGSLTRTEFHNHKGRVRVRLPFTPEVERVMGIKGWHYGVLRASAFRRMLDRLAAVAPDALRTGRAFERYEDDGDTVRLFFADGEAETCDVLVGADGIRSAVSRQAFGDPRLFHVGLRLWLAWCRPIAGLPDDLGVLHHSRRIQASYFPMLHDGEPAFEWWVVEPAGEGEPVPVNIRRHLEGMLAEFPPVMRRLLANTDVEHQLFRWDIYNRPSLPSYGKGRIACVGDAAHPVSPYAAYGMGMAIEDGYFLARALGGRDLADAVNVAEGFARYDAERVGYCNKQVEFARELGNRFHHSGPIAARLRDLMLDHTPVLQRALTKSAMAEQIAMTMQLEELHVATG